MTTYRRDTVKAPRAKGLVLKAFVATLESAAGTPVVDKLLHDSGLDRFRAQSAGTLPPFPVPLPHPATLPATSTSTELAASATAAQQASSETVAAFAAAYAAGASPVDVASRIETAVKRFASEGMGFFIQRHPEELAKDAEASASRHKAGKALSVLDGVPVVIKDEIDVKGFATTLGTSWRNGVADADSAIMARLRAAGALLVGKANMNEIGINPLGTNPHHGVARNPWNKTRNTGGSSSASAATVAAGLAPISIGADGGGSIRIPASLCGVVGLKATHGRVPETGIPPLCWTPGHAGPLGKTVADVAAAYAIIAGADPHDTMSVRQPPPSLADFDNADLKGVRIGVCTPYFDDADADVVKRSREALRTLTERGAVVKELPPPDLNRILWSHAIIILSEMASAMRDSGTPRDRFAYDSRTNLALGNRFSAMDYVHALRHRFGIAEETAAQLREVDVIASPTTASTAPPIPEDALPAGDSNLPVVDALMRFIRIGNLTGYPAISVPCGLDAQGLPVGFHLLARPWEEHLLLRLARVVETSLSPMPTPKFHTNLLA